MDTNDIVLHTLLTTQVTDVVHALSGHMIYLSTHPLPTQVTDFVHALSGHR